MYYAVSRKRYAFNTTEYEDYFPDLYKGQGITIHHLLTHTSGIPNYFMLKKQIKWGERHTPQEILQIVKGYKLKFPVGEKWSYNSTNYLILGLIIEMVSGMNYHQYVKNYIFIPAKMNNSGFIDVFCINKRYYLPYRKEC